MLPTFLAQFAAGCFLAVSASQITKSPWRYLRLMAIVSLALSLIAALLIAPDSLLASNRDHRAAALALLIAIAAAILWLFQITAQAHRITNVQRFLPAFAGLACLWAALRLAAQPDAMLASSGRLTMAPTGFHAALSITLGAALLGFATAAMLLGHRYLTDTDTPIAPLRRLTFLYLLVIAARLLFALVSGRSVWLGDFHPAGDPVMFWVALTARLALGLLATAIFAWMVHDCVRRRATQSATALFYLSMLFIFTGELASQYLLRTQSLAL